MLEQGIANISSLAEEDTLSSIDTEIKTMPNSFNEQSLWLLRRLVKLMESQAVVDAYNRQRVSVETIPTILGGYTAAAAATSLPTAGAPVMNASTAYFVQTWAGPVDPRWTNLEQAKINYNTGVRANLSFT
jgi:hypothetical protein